MAKRWNSPLESEVCYDPTMALEERVQGMWEHITAYILLSLPGSCFSLDLSQDDPMVQLQCVRLLYLRDIKGLATLLYQWRTKRQRTKRGSILELLPLPLLSRLGTLPWFICMV